MASPGPDEEFGDLFDYDIEDIEATGLGTAESETRPTEKSTVQGLSSRRAEDGDDVGGLVEVKLPSRRNKVKLDEARYVVVLRCTVAQSNIMHFNDDLILVIGFLVPWESPTLGRMLRKELNLKANDTKLGILAASLSSTKYGQTGCIPKHSLKTS